MPSFGQMKDMYRIQKEAKRIKKELKNVHVEAESGGVKVVVSAEQEVISIEIPEGMAQADASRHLIDALNRALGKAQLIASERMQGIMQQMGLGGAAGAAE